MADADEPKTPDPKRAARDVRPYWHVDAKWISGIALTAMLVGLLVLVGLWRLSAPERAIDLTTTLVVAAVSPEGLDADEGVAELAAQMRAAGMSSIDPLGLGLTQLTHEDFSRHSPREIRMMIFRPVAELLYHEDAELVAEQLAVADVQEFTEQAAPFGLLSATSHRLLAVAMGAALLLVGLVGWVVVRCSAGLGRIVSPSLILVSGALPASVVLLALAGMVSGGTGGSEDPGRVGTVIGETAPMVIGAFAPGFVAALVAGLAGLSVAGILRVRR